MYSNRFTLADDYLVHVDTVMGDIDDAFVRGRYLGFIVVSAVTAYELAIKDIFYRFADQKHKALGALTRSKYDKLNGRIRLTDLRGSHIVSFGTKYKDRFDRELNKVEQHSLTNDGISIKSSYSNLITWRHSFVHDGQSPTTTTYDEIKKSYHAGKRVIDCLDLIMIR